MNKDRKSQRKWNNKIITFIDVKFVCEKIYRHKFHMFCLFFPFSYFYSNDNKQMRLNRFFFSSTSYFSRMYLLIMKFKDHHFIYVLHTIFMNTIAYFISSLFFFSFNFVDIFMHKRHSDISMEQKFISNFTGLSTKKTEKL